jgi:hypothetical protein
MLFMRARLHRFTRALVGVAIMGLLVPAPLVQAQTPVAESADLAGLKRYMVDHVAAMKAGTAEILTLSDGYYALAKEADFDYDALWQAHADELKPWVEQAREVWAHDAHGNYELIEGMVAGIPSLSRFDEVIDAGPSKVDDPAGAPDLQVTLPDGQVLDRPGNLFHYLTEPALWGTEADFVGAAVDLDGDGTIEATDAIPDANLLLGAAQALDVSTAELQQAIADWEPNLGDAFTALVIMIPTMSGYFEEWKLSPYVLGEGSSGRGFVANSRLLDVLGILGGLDQTYDRVAPLIAESEPAMEAQIRAELDGLIAFVQGLYDRESTGTRFTPEQADQFGSELQTRATALAGQIAQAAALLNIPIQEG